jgi:hypothetical protein
MKQFAVTIVREFIVYAEDPSEAQVSAMNEARRQAALGAVMRLQSVQEVTEEAKPEVIDQRLAPGA